MKTAHCEELDNILQKKPHFIERYGILLTTALISIVCYLGIRLECSEYKTIKSIMKINSVLNSQYMIEINEKIDSNLSDFYLCGNDNMIKCKILSIDEHSHYDGSEILFVPEVPKDTVVINKLVNCKNSNSITIDLRKNYFTIITNDLLQSIQCHQR